MLSGLRIFTWMGSGLLAAALLMQPVSVDTQLSLALTSIAAMILIWRFGKGKLARQMFLALGSFMVMRYLYWRFTSTLPSLSDPLGFGFGMILLAAEVFCVTVLVISLTINADPLERKPLEREEDN